MCSITAATIAEQRDRPRIKSDALENVRTATARTNAVQVSITSEHHSIMMLMSAVTHYDVSLKRTHRIGKADRPVANDGAARPIHGVVHINIPRSRKE